MVAAGAGLEVLEGGLCDRGRPAVLAQRGDRRGVEPAGGDVGRLAGAHRRGRAGLCGVVGERRGDPLVVGRHPRVVRALEGLDQPAQVLLLEGGVQLLARGLHGLVDPQFVGLEPLEQVPGRRGGDVGRAEPVQLPGVGEAGPEERRLQQRRPVAGQRRYPGDQVLVDGRHRVVDPGGVAVLDRGRQRVQPGLEPLVGLAVGLFQGLVGAGALEVCEGVRDRGRGAVGLAAGREPRRVADPGAVDGQGGGVGEGRRRAARAGQGRGVPAPGLERGDVTRARRVLVLGQRVGARHGGVERRGRLRLDGPRVARSGRGDDPLEGALEGLVALSVGRLQGVVDRGFLERREQRLGDRAGALDVPDGRQVGRVGRRGTEDEQVERARDVLAHGRPGRARQPVGRDPRLLAGPTDVAGRQPGRPHLAQGLLEGLVGGLVGPFQSLVGAVLAAGVLEAREDVARDRGAGAGLAGQPHREGVPDPGTHRRPLGGRRDQRVRRSRPPVGPLRAVPGVAVPAGRRARVGLRPGLGLRGVAARTATAGQPREGQRRSTQQFASRPSHHVFSARLKTLEAVDL